MRFIVTLIIALTIVPVANARHLQSDRIDRLPTKVLAKEAKKVAVKQTYSHRHGHCSRYLQKLSYELVQRAFQRYGTQDWALYVVDRESGFCPGAINTTYSAWREQAKGLAQLIPKYHSPSIDYDRILRDPAYAVKVFVSLSHGGKRTGPWCLPCAS